jgi:hypothetical protein
VFPDPSSFFRSPQNVPCLSQVDLSHWLRIAQTDCCANMAQKLLPAIFDRRVNDIFAGATWRAARFLPFISPKTPAAAC